MKLWLCYFIQFFLSVYISDSSVYTLFFPTAKLLHQHNMFLFVYWLWPKILDIFQHLITCDLDGQRIQSLDDCLASLKQLDTKGKVWAQDMLLDVQGRYLQLSDIETKVTFENKHQYSCCQINTGSPDILISLDVYRKSWTLCLSALSQTRQPCWTAVPTTPS